MKDMSYYHRDQLESIRKTFEACERLDEESKNYLRKISIPYMEFRKELQEFNKKYFISYCQKACFENGRSACCGYESIIVFFADEVINYVFGGRDDFPIILEKLNRVKPSDHCVYLGDRGCLWTIRPISCAMFFCDDAKRKVFQVFSEAEKIWRELVKKEKSFTWPDKPVLFDLIEEFFIELGIKTGHMYFHNSPGLLKIKSDNRHNFPGLNI